MIDVTMATLFLSFIDMIIMPGIAFCICVVGVFIGNFLFRKTYPCECDAYVNLLSVSNTHLDEKIRKLEYDIGVVFAAIEPMVNIFRTDPENDNVIKPPKRRGRKKGSKNKV